MPATAVIETQIDSAVKDKTDAVLASLWLTVSDAVRLMLTRIAQDHALPFDPLIPNAETVEAMREARHGGLPSFNLNSEISPRRTRMNANEIRSLPALSRFTLQVKHRRQSTNSSSSRFLRFSRSNCSF